MTSICHDCAHKAGYFLALPKSEENYTGIICKRPAYTTRWLPLQDICLNFEPIASKDSCNGDCEHCANRDEWKEWAE